MSLNPDLLVAVFGYAGDKQQMIDLMPVYEHHQAPIVFMSPADSQVHGMGPHICRCAGKRAYIGQDSWDRQYAQLEILLQYPQKFFLLNDSDSFVLPAKLPAYLFNHTNDVFSNEVNDFRIPGQSWQGMPPWSMDYHKGYPLIAMQPPYFLSRQALEKIVATARGLVACPTTPFIDWWWVPATVGAGVGHLPFRRGASCETVTPLGRAVMKECISIRGAEFVHSIKNATVMLEMVDAYNQSNGRK